MIFRNNIW